MKKQLLPLVLIFLSCSVEHLDKDTEQIRDGLNSLVSISSENGCTVFKTGLDNNFDTVLQLEEVLQEQIVCPVIEENENTTLIDVVSTEDCIGGYYLYTGVDLNNNNLLDIEERETESLLCSGEDGTNGLPGSNGSYGLNSLINLVDSSNCEFGGIRVEVGLDDNNDTVLQEDEIDSYKEVCQVKCVHTEPECFEVINTDHCKKDLNYVMWLQGKHYENVSLQWKQFDDGTAVLEGFVRNVDNLFEIYEIIAVFSDKTLESSGKDHNCYDSDKTDWIYYKEVSGLIINKSTGSSYNLSWRGANPQLGINANNTESKDGQYGFSSWFYYGTNNKVGDFNISLIKCNQ